MRPNACGWECRWNLINMDDGVQIKNISLPPFYILVKNIFTEQPYSTDAHTHFRRTPFFVLHAVSGYARAVPTLTPHKSEYKGSTAQYARG